MSTGRWRGGIRGWFLGAGLALAVGGLILSIRPPRAAARPGQASGAALAAAPGTQRGGGSQATPARPERSASTPQGLAGILAEAQRVQQQDVAAWARYRFRRQAMREWYDDDGTLVEKEDLLFVVTPTTGGFDEELIRMNGAAPGPDEIERHRREARFTRHYNEMMQAEDGGDVGEAGYTLATLLKMSAYEYAGMEVANGVLCHRLDFRPDESLPWGGIAGKVARAMSGSLWITADGFHVAAARTRTVHPVALFLSLSKVKELEITMESQPAAEGVWLPIRIEVASKARVLFNVLNKLNTILYSDFEPADERPSPAGGGGAAGGPTAAGGSAHPRAGLEVVDERLDAARRLAPVEVLVGGVVAVLGEAQADEHDRRLEVPLHGDHGADRTSLADEGGGGAEPVAQGGAGGVGIGALERADVRLEP
jgi:hypothetical protein